jgi:NAD(P)-dependent dehydrogenase (short-subunit alcohol dehydrogenase family)
MSQPGSVILITGAASGIGRATASLLAARGTKLILTDIDGDRLGQLTAELGAAGHQTKSILADLTSPADIVQLVRSGREHFGGIDVLCNVAGLLDRALIAHEVTDQVWIEVLAVNLTAPFLLCREVLPIMLERGEGVIINMSSVAGIRGGRAGTPYTVAKHGLIGLSKSIGVAYGTRGIRCVTICPGALTVRTGDIAGGKSKEGDAVLNRARQSRPAEGTPDAIAHLIAFAISAEASHINATTLVADGGWTAV